MQICQARAWILSTGFTLAFGAMFSKVWRVHRFTTKAKTDPKVSSSFSPKGFVYHHVRVTLLNSPNVHKLLISSSSPFLFHRFVSILTLRFCHVLQKKVEPWKLYTMVSGLLAVDLVILLTWQLQDPLERRLETFPLEDPVLASDDVKIRPELEHCESVNNSVWLGEKMQLLSLPAPFVFFFHSIIDKVFRLLQRESFCNSQTATIKLFTGPIYRRERHFRNFKLS